MLETQIDDGGVQAEELVLEAQFFPWCQALGQGELIIEQTLGRAAMDAGHWRRIRSNASALLPAPDG
jgi:hypothetical protein